MYFTNLFVTAAIVKTQKRRLRVRRRNVPHFYSKSFGFGDFKHTQDTIAFLATTKKKSLCSRQDEHLEWNRNILGKVQIYTVEILTGITLATGSAFIDPSQL